jgi:hypothetical protein
VVLKKIRNNREQMDVKIELWYYFHKIDMNWGIENTMSRKC